MFQRFKWLLVLLLSGMIASQNMLFAARKKPRWSYLELRKPVYPFVTGDAFRAMADVIYDEIQKDFDPELVKDGDIIFVKGDKIHEFFAKYHPYISNPYVLITHNADENIPGKSIKFLEDEKLIRWFGQNVVTAHPKLEPIPIGMPNRYWDNGLKMLKQSMKESIKVKKDILLYMNFSVRTNRKERVPPLEYFKTKPFCTYSPRKRRIEYYQDLERAKYAISPPGNGLDAHRTWECLYMGVIPIILTSASDSLYLDMPALIVSSWELVTPQMLNDKYNEILENNSGRKKLHLNYWVERIESFSNKKIDIAKFLDNL